MDVYVYDPLLSRKEIGGFGVKAVERLTGRKTGRDNPGGWLRSSLGSWERGS